MDSASQTKTRTLVSSIVEALDGWNVATIVSSFGLCLILLWIGAFKFTPTESRQIMVYVENSPLMGWMYHVFSVETTSKLIGVTEIVAALAMIAGFVKPLIGFFGSLLSVVIFTVTSTFLLSTPGMVAFTDGMWHTSAMGSFVIKDLSLLGASLFLVSHHGRRALARLPVDPRV